MDGKRILLILIMGALFAHVDPALSLGQSWPVERGDPSHRASVNEAPPAFPLSLKWKTELEGPMYASPVVQLSQDNLYIGSNANKLWALNPATGEIRWIFEAAGAIWSCVAAISLPDSTGGTVEMLFVTCSGGWLYSLDPASGAEIWNVEEQGGPFVSSPNYAEDKVFYMYQKMVSSELRAVDAVTGQILWETASSNVSTAPPVIGQDALYLGTWEGGRCFQAIDPHTGYTRENLLADYWTNDGALTSGIPDLDRTAYDQDCSRIGEKVYISTKNGIISSIEIPYGADESQYEWETELESPYEITGLALTTRRGANNVLVVSQPDALQALSPSSGHIQWRISFRHKGSINQKTPKPAIWGDFVFHIVSDSGITRIAAFSLLDGTEEWSFDLDTGTYSSPAIAGDCIYIADTEGKVYAFSGVPRNDPYPVRPLHMWVASKQDAVRQYDGRTGFHIRDYVPPMLSGRPWDLTFGTDGLMYVSYFDTDVVKRFNRYNGNYVDDFFPPGTGGLDGAAGLRFGPDKNLYVASLWNHKIKRYNGQTGEYMGDFISGGLAGPMWLCWNGDLYVSSFHADAIKRFSPSGQPMGNFVAPGSGGLSDPLGLTFAADGNLYVASYGSDEIKCYNGQNGSFIRTVVNAGSGGLDGPADLQVDSEMRVTSYFTNEVKRYDPVTGEYLGNLVEACNAGLHRPMGIRLILIFNP